VKLTFCEYAIYSTGCAGADNMCSNVNCNFSQKAQFLLGRWIYGCRKALSFTVVLYLPDFEPDRVAAAHIRDLAVGSTRPISLSIFAQPSPDFCYRSHRAKFSLNFRHHSSMSRPHLKTKYLISTGSAAMMELCPHHIWCSLVHPLRSRSWKSAPP